MKKIASLLLAAALCLGLMAGCGSEPAASEETSGETAPAESTETGETTEGEEPAANKEIEKLTVAFVPSREPDEIVTATEPLKEMLTTELAKQGYDVGEVVINVGTSYEAVGEALSAGTADVGLIPGGTYVLYDDGCDVLLTATRDGLSKDFDDAKSWNDGKATEPTTEQVTYYRALIIAGPSEKGKALAEKINNGEEVTILNNFTSSYGATAVAAMGISQKIYMVPMYVSQGLSQGVMPLISYNYSSGNVPRMRKTVSFSRTVALSVIVTVAVLFFCFPGTFVSLFMQNEEIIQTGSRFLRGLCLGLPFLSIDFLAVGVFQAVGMGRESLIFAILRKIVLEIPALCLLNWLFPLYGLAYAQFVAEVVLATAAVLVLRRLFARLEQSVPSRG